MELKPLKCKALSRVCNLIITSSYIVGCTGRKAKILDKKLNLIREIDSLDYVYSAYMSPDEKKLLLISNGNRFYVVDMATGEKKNILVRAPYNYNLEGRGCWSFDGKSIYILAQHSKTLTSALRCYDADDLTQYKDIFSQKYCLTNIMQVEEMQMYLMAGYDRHNETRVKNKDYLIYYDGKNIEKYPLEDYGDSIHEICFDSKKKEVTTYSTSGCYRYTWDGKIVEGIKHPSEKEIKLSFSELAEEILTDMLGNSFDKNMVELFEKEEMNTVKCNDYITKCTISECGKYRYIASLSGFYIQEIHSNKILAEIPVRYGVQNFELLCKNIIALSTWSGIKLYEINQ